MFLAEVDLKLHVRHPHPAHPRLQKLRELGAVAVGKQQRPRFATLRVDAEVYDRAFAVVAHFGAGHGDEVVAVGLTRQKLRRRLS